ncbi:hypothetical protein D0T50_08845 [Bacteroides sp. 214]|nr:hypothetical protein [Bacteroides sp. 214]
MKWGIFDELPANIFNCFVLSFKFSIKQTQKVSDLRIFIPDLTIFLSFYPLFLSKKAMKATNCYKYAKINIILSLLSESYWETSITLPNTYRSLCIIRVFVTFSFYMNN